MNTDGETQSTANGRRGDARRPGETTVRPRPGDDGFDGLATGRRIDGGAATVTSDPPHAPLERYVQRRAGEYFRGLARYDARGAELLSSRSNLDESVMAGRVQELYAAVRSREEFGAGEELGLPSSVIQLRDRAVIVNFPVDDESGYLLGMEPDAARDLHAFVTECRRIIRGDRR